MKVLLAMKVSLALFGSVLLCASVASGAAPLIVPVHPPVWFPSLGSLVHSVVSVPLSEPAALFLLGVGLVLLARPGRRKRDKAETALSWSTLHHPRPR